MKKNLLYVFMTLAMLLFTACEQNQLDNTQNTISCTPSDTVIAAEGGEFVVAISSSNAWSATTNQKWITISPTSGQGDAYVTIQVAAGEQAEAKVLFATGANTATLTITRGEKQSSDDEEDPSNPNDGKTYPYLTIYDLMPLHLIPLADAESKLMDLGYTAEGVRYYEQPNLYFYDYTTTNNDTITLFTSAQDGIVEDVMYIASKGIAPQDAKEWLMHIPESLTLPVQERTVEFSGGYAYNFDLEEEVVYNYRDWISFVRNHNYDNITTEAVWGNVPEPEAGDHVVSMGYYYRNNIDGVSLCIAQVREVSMPPGGIDTVEIPPYLTIYDLMPLHLIPRADVDDILWEMGYTCSGSHNNLDGTFTHRYTTKHNDIIHILEISGGIVGSISYTASKGVELQATKNWLMHIPENIALPNWNKIMEFSSGSGMRRGSTDVEQVYDYQGWIELVSNYGCDNIWAYWEAEEEQSGDYAVSIGYDNSRDEAYLAIDQVYIETDEPGESEE